MQPYFQRVLAVLVLCATALAPSTFAENRTPRGTSDLERLAADLERALGRGSVTITREGRTSPAPERSVMARPSSVQAIVDAMNGERAARGLRALRLNETLSLAAGDRVGDMLAKGYFAHVSPDGIQPFVWATRRGYRYRMIGENLAVGYQGTAVVDGWMRSPGHRANILESSYQEVGIAVAPRSPQRGYSGPTVVALYASAK